MATQHHRPDADGVLEEGDAGQSVLRFTRRLAHPVDRVWAALAGWHWHLDALAGALDGRPADLVGVTGWDQAHERYLARAT
jgi:hypothetical protein